MYIGIEAVNNLCATAECQLGGGGGGGGVLKKYKNEVTS
jgi:hypothetical protein